MGENQPIWKVVDQKVGLPNHNNPNVSKGQSHIPKNYKGNDHMTQMQWRHHQRKKKVEHEAFATKCETPMVKRDMVGSNTLKKPFIRKLSDEDKKIDNHKLSLRIAPLGNSDAKREKTYVYTPYLEEKTPEYTPNPNDDMVEDNFVTESEDDLLINCGIVPVLPAE